MTAGRPTDYKDEYCELGRQFCLLGATDAKLAEFFGVVVSTIYKWKNDHPEFSDALNSGKDEADAKVSDALYNRALGYSHKDTDIRVLDGKIVQTEITKHFPPDPTSMIFWLKNRQKDLWRDVKQHTGADGEPLIPAQPDSDMETVRKLAFLLTKTATESEESK